MDTLHRLYELFSQQPRLSTDSRKIDPGCLFFALRGENFNGNRYAAAALQAGAAWAVVDDPTILPPASDATYERYIAVDNVLETLQALATLHRQTLGIPILAITGSNGKTTTKELIGRVLSRRWHTSITQGNLNNHIGVPLTLLSMNHQTEFGIVEMGASHRGEIARLCEIAQPDFGLITNIGLAHLEGFGGPDGVKQGKGELFDYLASVGKTVFYRQDDDTLQAMVSERPILKAIPYRASSLHSTHTDTGLEVHEAGITIRTHLTGDYNRNNIAAALAVGHYFQIPTDEIVAAIESYIPDNNRSQRAVTSRNVLILDAYNANPSSMNAALDNFLREESAIDPASGQTLPRSVILGDMRELGAWAPQAHRAIVERLRTADLQHVFLVGPVFCQVAQDTTFPTFANTADLCLYLQTHPLTGQLILIKGSRGIQLEQAVDLL